MTMLLHSDIEVDRGKFKDKRCWIIGAGPSLDKVDLKKIPKDQHVFALNAAITLVNFHPLAWWIFRDLRVVREVSSRLKNWRKWRVITHRKGLENLKDTRETRFKNVLVSLYHKEGVTHRRTIVEDALQLLSIFGFSEVNMVGVDHCVVDNRPYCKALRWKECYFYDPKKPPKNGASVALEAMVRAMEAIKPELEGLKVYNTSPIYPRPVFPYRSFEEAVNG